MIKNTSHFFLLFCIVLPLSGCINTQPKVNAINWNDQNAASSSMLLVKPNLTGIWVLNKDLSEKPQEELKQNMQKSKHSRGGKNKNGGGEHNGKGKGGRQGSNNSGNKKIKQGRGSIPQSFHALLKATESLELKHEEPLLTIITQDGQEKVYTDFRSSSVSSNNDPYQKITIAGWENNILVVENTVNSGRYILKFKLNSESKQLWVNTQILTSHLPKPVQFNRVYELVHTDLE